MTEKELEKERIFEVSSRALDAECQHCKEVYPEFEVSNCFKCKKITCDDDLYSLDLGNGDCSEEEYCPPCFDRAEVLRTEKGREELNKTIDRKIRQLQIQIASIKILNDRAMNCEGKTQIEEYDEVAENLSEALEIVKGERKGLLELLKEAK
jgi:hypothetical protein